MWIGGAYRRGGGGSGNSDDDADARALLDGGSVELCHCCLEVAR